MLFNSLDFAVFLPIVFALYWLCGCWRSAQNVIILAASYLFYGWWDPRFLILIALSSLIDYVIGRALDQEERPVRRKVLLGASIVANLGMLGIFKYFGFFVDAFVESFALFGTAFSTPTLSIILPVGISFYTFQTLSYTIDIYRRQIPATKSMLDFFAFVSFFPQLVAGPIERAKNLLPQFTVERRFEESLATDGVKQIVWGLFKKVAVADTLALLVNPVFAAPTEFSSSMLVLTAIFFTIQIYADFSGYSDIAIGTAKLFGFRLMVNFRYPLFATNIGDFWRRWHISLTTWFRDYVYYPLGGSRTTRTMHARNIFLVFLVSGLWHGAGWNFVIWGAIHGLAYIAFVLVRGKTKLPAIVGWLATFAFLAVTFVFFRAESIAVAWQYIQGMFVPGIYMIPVALRMSAIAGMGLSAVLFVFEWVGRFKEHPLQLAIRWRTVRFAAYFVVAYLTIIHLDQVGHEFIYFQF